MKRVLFLLALPVLLLFAGCAAGRAPAATPAPTEVPAPAETHNEWLEELPWEEAWTCLTLGYRELDPETGKAALRDLLCSYDWQLAEEEAEEAEYVPSLDRSVVPLRRQTTVWLGSAEEGPAARFHLRTGGDLWWNGSLYRPLGYAAGEELLQAWAALAETGESTVSPPPLTLLSGEESISAILHGTYSWSHAYRNGGFGGAESDAEDYRTTDWLGMEAPVLQADGPVELRFHLREPDRMSLCAFTDLGLLPLDLTEERFTPYAGVNTYVLSCGWDRAKQGGSGSCNYILLIAGAETNAPAVEETEELRLTVTRADAYGCAYTLEDLGQRNYAFSGGYALLRRTAAGGLEWVRPLRTPMDICSIMLEKGEARSEVWDWSHTYGTLEPGEYCLQLRGALGRGVRKEEVTLRQSFTVTVEAPAGPGPLTLCPVPKGITGTVKRLSPHRWVQTFITPETGWLLSRDFSLFRVTEDGTLRYIPPEYKLPNDLDSPGRLIPDRANAFTVELASRYGYLPAGEYVLRRAFFRKDPEDPSYLYARQFPEERVQYGDMSFIVSVPLSNVPRGVDPLDERAGYTGEGSTVLVSTRGSWFSASQARLRLELSEAACRYDVEFESDYFYLYFEHGGEWYPVEHIRYTFHGLLSRTLAPGEAAELQFSFTPLYGDLSPGLYRMVVSCSALPHGDGERQEGLIAAEFRIREDGTGIWQGLGEAEKMIRLYARDLRERYLAVPQEVSPWLNRRDAYGPMDPYVSRWKVERHPGRLLVTVQRDREAERARALLGGFSFVDILRAPAEEPGDPSPVTAENGGSRGLLEAILLEQPDPELYREGFWLLRFTWQGGDTADWDRGVPWYGPASLEVYDEEAALWRRLISDEAPGFAWGWAAVSPLEPGETVLERFLCLGACGEEFSPEKAYRLVLPVYVQPGRDRTAEYYTCPLPITEAGQA